MKLALSRHRAEVAVTTFLAVVLALNAMIKLATVVSILRPEPTDIYRGHPKWSIDTTPEVAMYTGSWERYNTHDGEHWALLFPHGGAVFLDDPDSPGESAPTPRRYTVAMMHQLECMDVLRAQFLLPRGQRDRARTHHCMNLLRQAILCRGDLQLDGLQYESHIRTLAPYQERRCQDWRAVYAKVAENQAAHAALLGGL